MELLNFGERLAKLRMIKGVSAREMSLALGQNESYINKIENAKSHASMTTFFEICFYLEITPEEFFEIDNNDPVQVREMVTDYKRLNRDAQASIAGLVKGMARDGR